MSSTNQLLGRSAAPYVLEHNGRAYHFRALGQTEKSAFRAWLLSRTREVLCTLYAGADLERELKTLTKDAVAGLYDVGGEVSLAVMATPDGVLRMASILSGCEGDEILELFGDRPEEVKHLLELVMAESMRRHGLKDASSNGQEGSTEGAPGRACAKPFPGDLAALETYKWAKILDHFTGLRPRDLAEMTDWQIDRLYLYPRDKDGQAERALRSWPPEERAGRRGPRGDLPRRGGGGQRREPGGVPR